MTVQTPWIIAVFGAVPGLITGTKTSSYVAFVLCFIIFAFTAIGPGRTVTLQGFFTFTFKSSLEPLSRVLAYPFLNALTGLIGGFLVAGLYNFDARLFRGVSIDLDPR